MNKPKIKLSFTSYRDMELDQISIRALTNLKDNTNFQALDALTLNVQTALTAFQAALAKAKHGGKEDTSIKKEKREVLEYALMELAMQVQIQSHGNEAILLSSGFELIKSREPIGQLLKPENLKANAVGLKGSIDLRVNPVKGAKIYQFEYTEVPVTAESVWNHHNETKSHTKIHHLTSGKEYAFRVMVLGKVPNPMYSNVVFSFVL